MQISNSPINQLQQQRDSEQLALQQHMENANKMLSDTAISAQKRQADKQQNVAFPSHLIFSNDDIVIKPIAKIKLWQSIFEPKLTFLQRLRRIPVLGFCLVYVKALLSLPQIFLRLNLLEHKQILQTKRNQELSQHVKDRLTKIDSALNNFDHLSIGKRLMEIDKLVLPKQLDMLKIEISKLRNALAEVNSSSHHISPLLTENNGSTHQGLADQFQDFYVDFENAFRGSKEDIKSRLEVYIPFIEQSPRDENGQYREFIDIGCGRGEWLELLFEHGIKATGIDLNRAMVEHCCSIGFDAVYDDAVHYLKNLPANSVGVITGFHIIEHIPFEKLLELFDAAHQALCEGGMIIFETPNPENLRVGAYSFYKDPTHLNPLVPCVVHFMALQRGFSQGEILRLHPFPDASKIQELSYIAEILNKELFGPQDYALIAKK